MYTELSQRPFPVWVPFFISAKWEENNKIWGSNEFFCKQTLGYTMLNQFWYVIFQYLELFLLRDHNTEIEGKIQSWKKKNLQKNQGWLSEMISTIKFLFVTVCQELIGIKANQQNIPYP